MKIIILILLCTLNISCFTYHFEPLKSEKIEIVTDMGMNYALFTNENVEMLILLSSDEDEDEKIIDITIKNISENSILIKDTDFQVEISNKSFKWKPLKVYSLKNYLALEEYRKK